ncbi:MAG: penicillin acylase family protein, partial [Candidatus Helarchaeota archaeon]
MKKSLIVKLGGSVIGAIVLVTFLMVPIGGLVGLGNLLSPIGGIWNGSNYAEYQEFVVIKGSGHYGTVYRDRLGIPHIFAKTYDDLAYIIGYLQARDRLFSMELQKRLIAGRLSEILGVQALQQDKFMRLLGFARSGNELLKKMTEDAPSDPELQEILSGLNAYCAGINRYIDEIKPYKLPFEYVFLGIQPEYWTVADIMAFLKFESYSLSFNEFDILMTLLKDTLGNKTVEELVPYKPYPFEKVVIPNFITNESGGTPKKGFGGNNGIYEFSQSSLREIPEYKGELEAIFKVFQNNDVFNLKKQIVQACSNNWVINGTLSYSGKPILSNDPHLPLILPPVWWEFQFTNSTPGSDDSVYGVSFPGAPVAEIGHTRYIAWGCTVTAYDQNDFYAEKFTADGKHYYFNKTELRKIETITETIKIKGSAPYYYSIKFTRHNLTEEDNFRCPVINSTDWGYPGDLNLSIKWTGYAPDYGMVKAFFRLNKAKSIQDYLDAMKVYSYPGQNFVFADVEGNIALYPKANYPVRNATGIVKQGRYILNGSNGEDEWTGYIPFDWVPHKINPKQMFLASANQRAVNTSEYTRYYTSYAFAESYRARRIYELLENESLYNKLNGSKITIEKMKRFQTDYYDVAAEVFVPYLLQAFNISHPAGVPNSGDWALINKSIEELKTWNESRDRWVMDKDLIAPTIFDTWLSFYRLFTLNDELKKANLSISGYAIQMLTDFIENLTRFNQSSKWFDNVSTPQKENASDIMLLALNATIEQLSRDLGEFTNWKWGNYHFMDIEYMRGEMEGLEAFNFPIYGCSGSSRTINVASGKYVHGGPSMRMIVDFEMLSNGSIYSGFLTLPGGQSGNPISSHYNDNYQYWKNNNYHLILFPSSINKYPKSQIYSTVVF